MKQRQLDLFLDFRKNNLFDKNVKKTTKKKKNFLYLDEAGVPKYLVGVTNEFELLHYRHRLVQVQDDSCGCDAKISLQRQSIYVEHRVLIDSRVASINQHVLVLFET